MTSSIGYTNFTIFLMLLTGVLMLRVDVKGYELTSMPREKKIARILAWLNIVGGLGVFIVNMVYQNMQI